MKAGALKCRVVLQQQNTGVDAIGQPTSGWATLATVWAEIKNRRGTETPGAGSIISTMYTNIRIRHRDDLTTGMRVLYAGTIYDISAVAVDQQNKDFVDLITTVRNGTH